MRRFHKDALAIRLRFLLSRGRLSKAGFTRRECGATPQGCTPHFLFETSKRKCAVRGGKEKMFQSKLARMCKFEETGSQLFSAKTCSSLRGTGGVRRSSGLVRRAGRTAVLGVQRGYSLLLFPLPLPPPLETIPQMDEGQGTENGSGSAQRSGTHGSRSTPIRFCSPAWSVPTDAGTQF